METHDGIEVRPFKNAGAWEKWLAKNYDEPKGVWIKIAKKSTGIPTIDHPAALDVALCYGWIDGMSRSLDETWYLQKFTPRRPKSTWSKINVAKVKMLIEAGKMKEPGLKEIDAAKADGRWDGAYESPKNATMPTDLAVALKNNTKAKAFFDTLNATNRYAVFHRLMTATNPRTRTHRLAKIIEHLEAEKSLHKDYKKDA